MHPMPAIQMQTDTFFDNLRRNPRPVVVDLWAPWCGPCRITKPMLEKLAQEYQGRVDLWAINADEHQELLRSLRVYGIPTLIVYQNGEETLRHVGVKPAGTLQQMFETLATGGAFVSAGLGNLDRLFRLAAGLAVFALGWTAGMNALFLLAGGIIMFTAVYDRCPIWRAITDRLANQAIKS